MKRRIGIAALAAVVAGALGTTAGAQEKIKLRVMGMPLATGNIQKMKEQPFFENFSQKTGLPIEMDYKPLESTGIKEFEQLRVMRTGLFDIAGLRLNQVSRDEPMILGLDLVGVSPDYDTARKVADAFLPVLAPRMEKQFNTKLLAIWPFGPQVIFCKPPIKSLADLKGLKVRVIDGVMAKFMEKVGATPVTMAFGEVSQGLSLGTVDCGITGPSSANTAGWPESVTHVYPLPLQMSVQGYAVSLRAWNKLDPELQAGLQKAISGLNDEIWTYSKELFDDAMRCNAGQDPCTTGKKYKLTTVEVTDQDRELVKSVVRDISFATWKEQCDASVPGCSDQWLKTVGPIVGLK